jgi:hypothetical protein
MSQLTPERRRVAILGGSIAAMSGTVALLQKTHPRLVAVWLGLLFVALVYVIIQLVKIRRSGK